MNTQIFYRKENTTILIIKGIFIEYEFEIIS